MILPKITSLQFLVLSCLSKSNEVSGQYLRSWLYKNRVKSVGSKFYQMMKRLENSGYVIGKYEQREIKHRVVIERRYDITAKGFNAWKNTCDFYSSNGKVQ